MNHLLLMNSPIAFTCGGIPGRLRSEWRLKITLTVLLNLWVYVPYCFLQHHHFFQPITMPASFCDRLIPFFDRAVWIYLSIYLLMPIGPFLMNNRPQIVRYATGVVLIGALADFVFFFRPTTCPRPLSAETIFAYRTLVTVDNQIHAFPSLHAAFAVFSALCAGQVLRELGSHTLCINVIWVWALFILLATLLTKQHMLADIAAGTVLAFCVHFCVFHRWNSRLNAKVAFQAVSPNEPQSRSSAL